ncbi:hypothetical protein FSP39_023944 [Pinctada imbricata]|uniref:Reverse transcriptase domain-containing protein n=1 Tax=Pinctada imbricata TaxID=66713 RepID=A0AA89C4F1_PINIB|nr:hypothetical protein FSP39_023944 [Pinctada imbricata]
MTYAGVQQPTEQRRIPKQTSKASKQEEHASPKWSNTTRTNTTKPNSKEKYSGLLGWKSKLWRTAVERKFFFRIWPATEETRTEPKIINISQRNLTETEIQLLEHGLKFTPTPMSDKVDLVKDMEEFCRKLRLREFFQSQNHEEESLVKNKKGFKPPLNRDKHLGEYIHCLRQSANNNIVDNHIKSNINNSQQKAIKDLQKDTSIVTKEADKGGAIVIMDANHYEQMALDQLEDTSFYKKLPKNEDRKTMSLIGRLIRFHGHQLTKNEIDYLTNFEVITSNFYGLPKIHKSRDIQENIQNCREAHVKIPKPEDLKLRPIIAGPSCSTQRLSNLLDILLKPLCKKVPSFIRDDMDFLNYIPESVPQNTILVSFDVTSLYTNIPHDLGIEAVTFWLEKFQNEIPTRFPMDLYLG